MDFKSVKPVVRELCDELDETLARAGHAPDAHVGLRARTASRKCATWSATTPRRMKT
jgi:hypothetical protein